LDSANIRGERPEYPVPATNHATDINLVMSGGIGSLIRLRNIFQRPRLQDNEAVDLEPLPIYTPAPDNIFSIAIDPGLVVGIPRVITSATGNHRQGINRRINDQNNTAFLSYEPNRYGLRYPRGSQRIIPQIVDGVSNLRISEYTTRPPQSSIYINGLAETHRRNYSHRPRTIGYHDLANGNSNPTTIINHNRRTNNENRHSQNRIANVVGDLRATQSIFIPTSENTANRHRRSRAINPTERMAELDPPGQFFPSHTSNVRNTLATRTRNWSPHSTNIARSASLHTQRFNLGRLYRGISSIQMTWDNTSRVNQQTAVWTQSANTGGGSSNSRMNPTVSVITSPDSSDMSALTTYTSLGGIENPRVDSIAPATSNGTVHPGSVSGTPPLNATLTLAQHSPVPTQSFGIYNGYNSARGLDHGSGEPSVSMPYSNQNADREHDNSANDQ
jgi:hypothetical protein